MLRRHRRENSSRAHMHVRKPLLPPQSVYRLLFFSSRIFVAVPNADLIRSSGADLTVLSAPQNNLSAQKRRAQSHSTQCSNGSVFGRSCLAPYFAAFGEL